MDLVGFQLEPSTNILSRRALLSIVDNFITASQEPNQERFGEIGSSIGAT